MATRSERGETHISNLAGKIRNITGSPHLVFTDETDPSANSIGAMCYSTDRERLYINTTGTRYGWKFLAIAAP